jgi:hypothetical protein
MIFSYLLNFLRSKELIQAYKMKEDGWRVVFPARTVVRNSESQKTLGSGVWTDQSS